MPVSGDTKCRICGLTESQPVATKNGHRYVRCAGCDVARMLPYPGPDEVRQYYEKYLDKKRIDNPVYLTESYWDSFSREKDLTFGDLRYPVNQLGGKARYAVSTTEPGKACEPRTHRCRS